MGEIVGCGSDAGVEEIAEHEEVGREEEDGEEKPTGVEVPVGEEGESEDDGFFDAKEDGRASEHGSFIRDWWRDSGYVRRWDWQLLILMGFSKEDEVICPLRYALRSR